MTERPSHTDPFNDTGAGPRGEAPPGTPRWVKVLGLLTALIAVLFVALMLAGGHHGPGRHFRSGSPSSQAAPADNPR